MPSPYRPCLRSSSGDVSTTIKECTTKPLPRGLLQVCPCSTAPPCHFPLSRPHFSGPFWGAPAVVHFHLLVLFTHAFVRVCLRYRCSPNASGSTIRRRGSVTLAAVPAPVLSVLSGRRTGRRHDRSEEITVGRLLVGTSCASRRCGQFGGQPPSFSICAVGWARP